MTDSTSTSDVKKRIEKIDKVKEANVMSMMMATMTMLDLQHVVMADQVPHGPRIYWSSTLSDFQKERFLANEKFLPELQQVKLADCFMVVV